MSSSPVATGACHENPAAHLIVLVSGPSGSGKSTLIERLLAEDPGIGFSVSVTTRPPRAGEVDGRDYRFVSDGGFDAYLAADAFVEWAEVYGKRYGTPKSEIERLHREGKDVLFDLDTVGGRTLMATYRDVVSVFVLPPEYAALKSRLEARGTDAPEVIARRLGMVAEQSAGYSDYRYLIVNEDLDRAFAELVSILWAERARTLRNRERAEEILATFRVPRKPTA